MSSLKMTFSLASLILIIALIAAPAMAAQVANIGIGGTLDATADPVVRFGLLDRKASGNVDGTADDTAQVTPDTATPGLPNLKEEFRVGTTIALLAPAAGQNKSKDVVISEIMWGQDSNAENLTARNVHQFIEFYNTTSRPAVSINMANWRLYIVNDPLDIPTPADFAYDHDNNANTAAVTIQNVVELDLDGNTDNGNEPYVLVDMVSNEAGGNWVNDIGQSGTLPRDTTTVTPVPLVSMYRKINYTNVLKEDHNADVPKNRVEQLKAIPDGTAKGSWAASTQEYAINLKGSPGDDEPAASLTVLKSSTVDLKKVIINEIGNSSNNKYDWIELRNTSGADISIEKYQLSNVVGTTKADVRLFNFPKISIPKDDVLLVVNTEPKTDDKHPLAGGINVIDEEGTNAGDLVKRGIKSRYYVNPGLVIPDAKVLLILRSTNDGNNTLGAKALDKLVDVTGTASIADNANTLVTGLWPLVRTGAANGKAIKGATKFANDTVYRRNKADQTTGAEEIWVASEDAGGIGYARQRAGNGTPGYQNDAAKVFDKKSDDADYKAAPVTISEIMYDSRGNLPQWIELYNSSMTDSVKIEDWQLKLENADDVPIRTPAVTVKLANKIIPPNQTVLIVAASGRKSDDFPDDRVLEIWKNGLKDKEKDKLEIADGTNRRSFAFLSETVFKVTLMDKAGVEVDTAGNMKADGSAAWTLPTAEGNRASIIRRYNEGADTTGGKGMANDGTLPVWSGAGSLGEDAGGKGKAGWVLASASILALTQQDTYYGSSEDEGSPGFRAGGPLPVSLSKFRPERLDDGSIVIRWITESELNNAGFNILRSEKRDGQFTKINTSLIAGQGTTSERTTYSLVDTSAKPNVVYYYQIQDVSLDGEVQTLRQSRLKGDISPAGKLTTIWGEIKALR